MPIIVTSDWQDFNRETDRLGELPIGHTAALDVALDAVFAEVLAVVHVITGSLKASGQTSTSTTENRWTGTMTFGGVSPGSAHDPVKYAHYERRRGGVHDFMLAAIIGKDLFPLAVRQTLGSRT